VDKNLSTYKEHKNDETEIYLAAAIPKIGLATPTRLRLPGSK